MKIIIHKNKTISILFLLIFILLTGCSNGKTEELQEKVDSLSSGYEKLQKDYKNLEDDYRSRQIEYETLQSEIGEYHDQQSTIDDLNAKSVQ